MIAVAIIGIVAIGTVSAHAQGAGNRSAVEAAAVALNRRSNQLYREGHYAEAIALLREAYRLNPDPVLQYNLARSCDRLGDYECAINGYEIYLAAARPSDRASIEARLVFCRARLAAARAVTLEPSRTDPPPRSAPTAPPPWLPERPSGASRSRRGVLPLVVAGAGVSAITAGLGLVMVARSTHDAAVDDPSQTSAANKHQRAESLMRAGNITLVAGGALAATGILWWALDRSSHRSASPEPRQVTAAIQADAWFVAFGGAF